MNAGTSPIIHTLPYSTDAYHGLGSASFVEALSVGYSLSMTNMC
ncbi:MAG: hypothetical protein QXS10_06590 [Candidatus Bathyarchaeia archaeon]